MLGYGFDGDSRMPGEFCRLARNPALGCGYASTVLGAAAAGGAATRWIPTGLDGEVAIQNVLVYRQKFVVASTGGLNLKFIHDYKQSVMCCDMAETMSVDPVWPED